MKKFLIFVLVVTSCIALGVAGWFYYPKYQIYKMKNASAPSVEAEKRSVSYIDYVRQLNKPELKHLALGDSIIRGIGAGENESFVDRFSAMLEQQTNKPVVLQNEGVAGMTSSELNALLQTGKLDESIQKADIITINIGGNDIIHSVKNRNYLQAIQSFDGLQAAFVDNLAQITTKVNELNPKAIVVLLELYNPLEPGSELYSLADQLLPKWNVKLYEAASRFSSSIVIETTKVINGKHLQYLSEDGVHPNALGYDAISKQMLQQFQNQSVGKPV
ncbi:GDSL-type esterase/lipase family protein [Ectobacillus funiculus]|uniref:GDSL-type esterase/lipase family protein n=1 Tax=Ectobacillus funiculus TaxID=137993 RepID=A0ABV5WHS5_9BACI|nr:GDSL-type esterase/lipase family protein [Ectobacillus funiculus]